MPRSRTPLCVEDEVGRATVRAFSTPFSADRKCLRSKINTRTRLFAPAPQPLRTRGRSKGDGKNTGCPTDAVAFSASSAGLSGTHWLPRSPRASTRARKRYQSFIPAVILAAHFAGRARGRVAPRRTTTTTTWMCGATKPTRVQERRCVASGHRRLSPRLASHTPPLSLSLLVTR